ncbi:RNA polymerase sigma factor SigM [Planctomycetes bacterium Pan216]|uniref:RNA polymerase sigma factor SigM n=1 Tax=Kolteria novifilia TaxID=2527975 RepID=A0A518AYB2_9BACT|nr:RNA polymerase sigma factor SigM [Planctomycetes bacterium Pan216]
MTQSAESTNSTWIASVLERYEGKLVRYAARIVGDWDRARDVVQETMLRLCHAPRSDVEDHLAEWLYTVCRNRALDVCRKERRMTLLDDAQASSRPSTCPTPAESAEVRDDAINLKRELEALPPRHQEVVRLRFEGGLSYREISRVTKHSESYVGVLIHEGLKRLRQRMTHQTTPHTPLAQGE